MRAVKAAVLYPAVSRCGGATHRQLTSSGLQGKVRATCNGCVWMFGHLRAAAHCQGMLVLGKSGLRWACL